MFVYYYVHLSQPFETVERGLLDALGSLDGWAAAAYREGEAIRARIGVGGERRLIAKAIRMEAGAPRRGTVETTVPLTWEATGTPGLFPRMEADLVVAALGPDLTQISLRGSYRPPLGAIGRAVDRTLLHRLAEASVKGLLDRVAHELGLDTAVAGSPAE
ncbi:MAG: hypothetical protein HY775_04250 [Acidobacteria bacterium]|nr:hypothetical protein [Acidobacteriota bacterium]